MNHWPALLSKAIKLFLLMPLAETEVATCPLIRQSWRLPWWESSSKSNTGRSYRKCLFSSFLNSCWTCDRMKTGEEVTIINRGLEDEMVNITSHCNSVVTTLCCMNCLCFLVWYKHHYMLVIEMNIYCDIWDMCISEDSNKCSIWNIMLQWQIGNVKVIAIDSLSFTETECQNTVSSHLTFWAIWSFTTVQSFIWVS